MDCLIDKMRKHLETLGVAIVCSWNEHFFAKEIVLVGGSIRIDVKIIIIAIKAGLLPPR